MAFFFCNERRPLRPALRGVIPALVLAMACATVACQQERPLPPGLDIAQFKLDKNACAGKRAAMVDPVDSLRPQLMGLNEVELVKLLGPADATNLASRSQKFYIYYLTPGKQCQPTLPHNGLQLRVRINALQNVNEVSILRF